MEAAALSGVRLWMLLLWLVVVFFLLEPLRAVAAFPFPFFGPSYTNQQDVDAMNELYTSLGSPDLHGWAASGGDPCDEQLAWQGVRCLGPNITAIELKGAGLEGKLSEALGKLTAITTLDLSWNNLSGELPDSMENLRSLSSLHVQNNQLTGKLDVLRDLPLKDLNVENNRLSGSIPEKLLGIPKFLGNGNKFTGSSPAPATPTSPPPAAHPRITVIPAAVTPQDAGPPRRPHGKKVSPAKAAGLSVLAAGSLSIAVLVTVLAASNRRRRRRERSIDGGIEIAHPSSLKNTSIPSTVVASDGRRSPRYPLEFFTVASLQQFTNSFSDEKNLMRETRFGKVYLAEHPEGKFAVLKLRGDTSGGVALPAGEFVKKVRRIAGLEHPNIEELVGCCVEHGQRLLVYRHFSDRTLDDMIHTDGGDDDPGLPWDARVAVALEAAKALEHLHEGGGRQEEPGKVAVVVVHGHFGAEHVLVDGEGRVRVSGCGFAPFAAPPSGTRDWRGDGDGAPSHGEQPLEEAMTDDVYSLGVVMLQLLTGSRPYDGGWRLVPWAGARLHDMSALRRMADPRLLRGTAAPVPVRSLSRFADIISRCVQPEPEFRPAMAQVVQDLRRAMEEARAVAAVERSAPTGAESA